MNWKDFFKPSLAKLVLMLVIIILIVFSMYSLQKTSFTLKNPNDISIHIGIPIALTKNIHCCGFSELDGGFGFCKCGVSSDYGFNFVNLILNLIWTYVASCLIWNAYLRIKFRK